MFNTSRIAIIIPTYNERETIGALLGSIAQLVPNADVFVADDRSPDQTAHIVRAVERINPRIHLVLRTKKAGRGAAVLAGFRHALQHTNATVFVEMDADQSHQVAEIPALLRCVTPHTVAIASRHISKGGVIGWPLIRHVFSAIANSTIRMVLGLRIRDATNGFRAYPRTAVELLSTQTLESSSYIVLSETALILSRAGFFLQEIPSIFIDRRQGTSNTTLQEIMKNTTELFDLWRRYQQIKT